jgi:uncharacterized membrane protein YkoI
MKARAISILCAAVAALSPIAAHAQPSGDSLGAGWRGDQQEEARRGVQQGNVPLAQVIATIARRTPGNLLDAGLETGPGGRPVYRVRWATTDGRRIDYLVDARSGAILSAGGG